MDQNSKPANAWHHKETKNPQILPRDLETFAILMRENGFHHKLLKYLKESTQQFLSSGMLLLADDMAAPDRQSKLKEVL
jgi:hypothetical protein